MHGPVASPAPVPPTARVSAASPGDEEAFEQAARAEFQTTARRETAAMRTLLQGLGRAPEARQSQTALDDLQQKVRHFANNAGIAGARLLGRLASAFEALLKEVHDRPDQLNASILRTFAQATDHLARSVEKLDAADPFAGREPRVLAVDDETLSRKAVHFALQKVGLDALSLDDPQAALNLLRLNRFGLVVLDVDMPGLSGFDLCQQARATPLHGTTPIVFVTGLTDFESRAKSSLSGGSDLIAKPFLFMELGLKALIHLHKLAP
jgi:PleD family two-component response regulator